MEWIKVSIAPVKDLIAFLQKKSNTADIHKKQLLIELRDNLNVFSNGFLNNVSYDMLIDLLKNDAYQNAIRENFNFKNFRQEKLNHP